MRLACLAYFFLIKFISNEEKEGKRASIPSRLSLLPVYSLDRFCHKRSDLV